MRSKILIIFILCCASSPLTYGQIAETTYFEFHSNFWVNLHHFLYEKASNEQKGKLEEDRLAFEETGEKEAISNLSPKDQEILEKAISYYRDYMISQSLFRKLPSLTYALSQEGETIVAKGEISPSLADALNLVAGPYRQHIWPVHDDYNKKVLSLHLDKIRKMEPSVISKMEELSLNEFPNSEKVRIDLSAYASWSGAYTITDPFFNIYISSLDPTSDASEFIETVFHESTHLLFRYGSPFRELSYNTAQELKVEQPRSFWHACLFYLCGKVVQQELQQFGIEHELVMDTKNIFSKVSTTTFRDSFDLYISGELSAKEALVTILNDLKP